MTDLSRIVIDSAADAEPRLTALLRHNATQAGWPSEVALTLSVRSEGSSMYVEGASERAVDLEYGTLEDRPIPAVRQFVSRSQVVEAEVLRAAESRLGGIL